MILANTPYGVTQVKVPMPLWFLRRKVRRNPWLLSDHGAVTKTIRIPLFPFVIEWNYSFALLPKQKAMLQAEMDAGTLVLSAREAA